MSKSSKSVQPIETLRHKEAFQFYYGLGDNRKLTEVAKEYKVSLNTAKKWSGQFNWQYQLVQRDIEIGRKLDEKQMNEIIAAKAKYRKKIGIHLGICDDLINMAIEKVKKGEIVIDSVQNFDKVFNAYERIVKLDMLLLNEYQSAGVDEKNMQVIVYQPAKETEEESVDASDLEKESE